MFNKKELAILKREKEDLSRSLEKLRVFNSELMIDNKDLRDELKDVLSELCAWKVQDKHQANMEQILAAIKERKIGTLIKEKDVLTKENVCNKEKAQIFKQELRRPQVSEKTRDAK